MGYLMAVIVWWSIPGQPDEGLYRRLRVFHGENRGQALHHCVENTKGLAASWKKMLPAEIANNTRVRWACQHVGPHA
jgi:hypothetical protein